MLLPQFLLASICCLLTAFAEIPSKATKSTPTTNIIPTTHLCIAKSNNKNLEQQLLQIQPQQYHQYQPKRYLNRTLTRQPKRALQIEALRKCEYDVLVIGGGATGVACALDAVTRGLRTALVEGDDFGSGNTLKSTKLLHGGIPQLYRALKHGDFRLLRQVRTELRERATLCSTAPHLTRPLPVLVPLYSISRVPSCWLALKCCGLVEGSGFMPRVHYISKERILEAFPLINEQNLVGGMVYADMLYDEARLCIGMAQTATEHGAAICNYLEVVNVDRCNADDEKEQRVVHVNDRISEQQFSIKTNCIINATGVFIDLLRLMDCDEETLPITQPSTSTHIVLPSYFCSKYYALFDPFGKEGRLSYILPWRGHTIASSSEVPSELSKYPRPTKDEVHNLLDSLQCKLSYDTSLSLRHVRSAWAGVRQTVLPEGLALPDLNADLAAATEHIVEVSPNRMITVAGGPGTTTRIMAQDAIDMAISYCNLPAQYHCMTAYTPITGSKNWTPHTALELVQMHDIPIDIARHLSDTYGTNAFFLLSNFDYAFQRLHNDFPYIEAEVHFACEYEYAVSLTDIIGRRLGIAFLDVTATLHMMPRIVKIMAKRLNWSNETTDAQIARATDYLKREMGMGLVTHTGEDLNMVEERWLIAKIKNRLNLQPALVSNLESD